MRRAANGLLALLAAVSWVPSPGARATLVFDDANPCPPGMQPIQFPPARQVTAQYCRRPDSAAVAQASSLGLSSLAACPAGSGFRPLSSVHPVTAVTVGLDQDPAFGGIGNTNMDFVQRLADILRETQPGVPLNIVVPQRLLDNSAVRNRLNQVFGQAPYDTYVNLQPTPATNTLWARDYMMDGVKGAPPAPSLHAMVYSDGASATAGALATACGIASEPTPPKIVQRASGNIGGNVVPMPGGVNVVGDTMAEPVKTSLFGPPGGANAPVTVQSSWLSVGHADEMFNVVPTSDPPPCNFAILYASPKLGLDLLNANKDSPYALEPRAADAGSDLDDPVTTSADLFPCEVVSTLRHQNHVPLTVRDIAHCPSIQQANQRYEEIIQQNLAAIKGQVAARSGCSSPKATGLPQLYLPKSSHSPYGTPSDQAVALNPGAVNGMVINRTMVVPDQPFPAFKTATRQALERLGVVPRFLEDAGYHYNDGEIHCATNEVRTCEQR